MFLTEDYPVLGILRGIQEKDILPLSEIFVKTGLRHVEITMNTRGATNLIDMMIKASSGKLMVGAGTVLNEDQLEEALQAGARFIVSPSTRESIVKRCVSMGIPVFPGALTPTEVHLAWEMGATMVKLFPSGMYGPGYIKALKGPFDSLKIMAVGGINEQTVSKYFLHGADAVAFGAGVVRPNLLEEGRFDLIEEKIRFFLDQCKTL